MIASMHAKKWEIMSVEKNNVNEGPSWFKWSGSDFHDARRRSKEEHANEREPPRKNSIRSEVSCYDTMSAGPLSCLSIHQVCTVHEDGQCPLHSA